MHDIGQSLLTAVALVAGFDPELIANVTLSLRVSLSATLIAMLIGAPLGGLLAVSRFRGRQSIIVVASALLGLPPVVVGLVVYLVLSRSGPAGFAGLLYTPTAMIIAQVVLATPIVDPSTGRSWRLTTTTDRQRSCFIALLMSRARSPVGHAG